MDNEVMELIDQLYTMVSEAWGVPLGNEKCIVCLLYTSPSPRDRTRSRMPSSA